MPMLPRSYDERVYTDVHKVGYKLTSNSIGEFGVPPINENVYTVDGMAQKMRNVANFEKHCAKHREDEMWRFHNRRQIYASQTEPRWAYSKNNGSELATIVSDPNNLFKKSLDPLDKRASQI